MADQEIQEAQPQSQADASQGIQESLWEPPIDLAAFFYHPPAVPWAIGISAVLALIIVLLVPDPLIGVIALLSWALFTLFLLFYVLGVLTGLIRALRAMRPTRRNFH